MDNHMDNNPNGNRPVLFRECVSQSSGLFL